MIPSRDRAHWIATHILPHEPALRAWLRSRAVAGLETDDVIQETYAVLAGLAGVEHIESPRAYAFQTAQSIVLRHLRRARIVRMDRLDEVNLQKAALDEPSPEQQVSARQALRRVAELISELPAKRREAFTLRKIHGLSQRDIARRMGISESTVEKHIGRALHALMEAYRHSGMLDVETSLEIGTESPEAHDTSRN